MVSPLLERPTRCKEPKPTLELSRELWRFVFVPTRAFSGLTIAMKAMFEQKASLQRSSVELAVSYMEIYKDEVYDLLVNRETVSLSS